MPKALTLLYSNACIPLPKDVDPFPVVPVKPERHRKLLIAANKVREEYRQGLDPVGLLKAAPPVYRMISHTVSGAALPVVWVVPAAG